MTLKTAEMNPVLHECDAVYLGECFTSVTRIQWRLEEEKLNQGKAGEEYGGEWKQEKRKTWRWKWEKEK